MNRLGILGSTRGTAMLPVIEAIIEGKLDAQIELIISNKSEAQLLTRAKTFNISHQFVDPKGLTRDTYDNIISSLFKEHKVELILLIGYMRILSSTFISDWQHKIMNIHPSLLPEFAGKMDLDVHEAVLKAGRSETGCTVHYVTEEVDGGPIVLQRQCNVLKHDTPHTLKARVQALEGPALIDAVNIFFASSHHHANKP